MFIYHVPTISCVDFKGYYGPKNHEAVWMCIPEDEAIEFTYASTTSSK